MAEQNSLQLKPCEVPDQKDLFPTPRPVLYGHTLTLTTDTDWNDDNRLYGIGVGDPYYQYDGGGPTGAPAVVNYYDDKSYSSYYAQWEIIPLDPSLVGTPLRYESRTRPFYLRLKSPSPRAGHTMKVADKNVWPRTEGAEKTVHLYVTRPAGRPELDAVEQKELTASDVVFYGETIGFSNVDNFVSMSIYKRKNAGYSWDGNATFPKHVTPQWQIWNWGEQEYFPHGGQDPRLFSPSKPPDGDFTKRFKFMPGLEWGMQHGLTSHTTMQIENAGDPHACFCDASARSSGNPPVNYYCEPSPSLPYGGFASCLATTGKWESCERVLDCKTGEMIRNVCPPEDTIIRGCPGGAGVKKCCDASSQTWRCVGPATAKGSSCPRIPASGSGPTQCNPDEWECKGSSETWSCPTSPPIDGPTLLCDRSG